MDEGAQIKDLSARQENLLMVVVDEFVSTAQPIGSHHIARRYSLGIKAATIRSIMGELEQKGYLTRPHASAGRVPTEKAFRQYVDRVLPHRNITFSDRSRIELHYSIHHPVSDFDAVIRETSRMLASLTGQAAMVMAPRLEDRTIERVNFLRIRTMQVLVTFVARGGAVHNRLVETDHDHSQDELDRMARYLNDSMQGRTLEQVRAWIARELGEERARYDSFMREALSLGKVVATWPRTAEIYIEGGAQVCEQPEFSDNRKLRELIRALEDKTALLELLERSLGHSEPTVSIGTENFDARLAEFSVVAASYTSEKTPPGSLAVLGPLRMDYPRIIPLVDYTARTLSRLLDE
jgi:heat-inducible transcriptional repressor